MTDPGSLERAPRVAIFDYRTTANNPVGGCHLRLLEDLCDDYGFTVFSLSMENPRRERIGWVRVPVPGRPLAVLFILFHIAAPVRYALHKFRTGISFDLVHMVESNLWFGDVCYAHFCHRAYLRENREDRSSSRVRAFFRWLDHRLHAMAEGWVFRRARVLVVPSEGLRREIEKTYPGTGDKIRVIPNPLDPRRYESPEGFDRSLLRLRYGFSATDLVLVFVALGHFERKGLPSLLEALALVPSASVKLMVVGGEAALTKQYGRVAERLGISSRVAFAGMQKDVRPFYWSADAFALPSSYETYSLVACEAAASGLPLLISQLHGVSEFHVDKETGYVVDREPGSLARAIDSLARLEREERRAMGERARNAVSRRSLGRFAVEWKRLYAEMISR